ncbi:MAG: hypothetical protein KJ712_07310 [Bacteroidetes bacterium]|nr:hypothetical protein [Bacteroidota bacterium]MBU1484874.1 hypothetical protein [Bacteroidota bacterium]MBU1761561.1 hypothetical protein [Bacteroidota bacterium]MBU2046520.1 hypothetical protein [Bacteroidota bacterium]MBU2266526.1 hypothetical protein [Bacteroidota bacterium]
MNIWELFKQHYIQLGEKYEVDPLIFLGIHVIATPLFALTVWWLVYSRRKHKSLIKPTLTTFLVFNAANIYLLIAGRNIPLWIYLLLLVTTLLSGYFSWKKIEEKLKKVE